MTPAMRWTTRQAGWLLPVLVVLLYWPSLDSSFQFDDYNVIVDQPAVHSLDAWWRSMPGIRPLLKLSYALNWTMAPESAAFRAVNIGLHAINSLLVWLILSELAYRRALPAALPLLAAALFAVHPVQTEAVTYVSGRSVSLMALFYLSSLIAWLRAERLGSTVLKRLSVLAFVCAFLTKEVAIILPAALWLLVRLVPPPAVRMPVHSKVQASIRSMLYTGRWPLAVAVAALAFLLTLPAYRHFLSTGLAQRSPLDNLALQVDAVYVLISHLLQPSLLNADPDWPVAAAWQLPLAARAALLALLIALGWRAWRQRSFAGFCVLWFFIHLAPTNSLIPRLDVVNDRQLYLSSIGAFAAVALMVTAAWQRVCTLRFHDGAPLAPGHRGTTLMVALLTLAVLAGTGWQTVVRNRVYRDEIVFWQDVTAKSPQNARAFNNLGYAYQLAGRHAEARAAYLRALSLRPSLSQARWNLDALPANDATAPPSPDHPSSAR